jgi:DDE superfamily endonuclease
MYGIINKKRPLPREKQRTVIQIYNINNRTVARTTSFRSVASMLSFIIIVCNGDIQTMSQTTTTLTWIEEWFFYFERVYGRSVRRMIDCSMKYKTSIRMLRTIFNNKLKLVIAARNRWPLFVTMEEDHKLRDDKWDSTYEGKRIVMWDNTDVRLATPSNANLQRNTWSDYYNGNVGKGSVFIQLCGWMGTHELWEGAVSDTDYFTRSGILQLQQQYIEMYDSGATDSEWIIILDRGYKVVGQCFATGKQKCLQPTFTRSNDPKFSGNDTQLTAAVASDRGANERAV